MKPYSVSGMRSWRKFNLNLKIKIIENFGSQTEFAAFMDIDDAIVSKVIRGSRKLSPQKQKLWAFALNCKDKDIF